MGKIFFMRRFYIQTNRAVVFSTFASSQWFCFEPFWPGLTSSCGVDADCSPAYLNLTIALGAPKLVVLWFWCFNFIFNLNVSFFIHFNLVHMPSWSCIFFLLQLHQVGLELDLAVSAGMGIDGGRGHSSTFGLALNLNSCSWWYWPENTQLTLIVSLLDSCWWLSVAKSPSWN